MAFTSDPVALNYAIKEGLYRILRDKLREEFEAQAKPIIDRAVKEAMESMELGVQQMMQPMDLKHLVEVTITDKRSKD